MRLLSTHARPQSHQISVRDCWQRQPEVGELHIPTINLKLDLVFPNYVQFASDSPLDTIQKGNQFKTAGGQTWKTQTDMWDGSAVLFRSE